MTAWVANWFTYGNTFCFHEGTITYGTVKDLIRYSDYDSKKNTGRIYGDSNSALCAIYPEEIIRHQKELNIGYVSRDLDTVLKSYDKINPDPAKIRTEPLIKSLKNSLQNVLSQVDYTEIDYDDLLDETSFQKFHEQMTPTVPFMPIRYRMLKDLIITQKVREVYERVYKR
jgi:hypothetical protein